VHYLEISRYLLGNFLRIITYSLASFNVCLANCKSWSQSTNIHTTILYLRGFHHLTRPFPLKPSCVLLQASYIISKAWVAQFFFFFFQGTACEKFSWDFVKLPVESVCRNTHMPRISSHKQKFVYRALPVRKLFIIWLWTPRNLGIFSLIVPE
jgi:hypothetical protein